jgi:hypothetical protein
MENAMRDEQQPMIPPDSNEHPEVDASRRRFAKAGLGGSAVLITLASRPVLGATCLTPSAAGSGNHSQHNPIACTPHDVAYWLSQVPRNLDGNIDVNTAWPGQTTLGQTTYKPSDLFHPLFTASSTFEYNDRNGNTGNSYNLYEVLSGKKINDQGKVKGDLKKFTDPNDIGKWFVAGLLNASANFYGGVIEAIGPDPSVRGIEDEFATNGFFQATAGKKWYASTIIAYLQDPGSVF